MQLAGIELRYLINEINRQTEEYYLSNIYGITRNSLLFKFHHPEKEDILLMLSTKGIWLTKVKIDQIEPNKLLRRLRNDLLRFKLKRIKQIGTERIAYLDFTFFEREFIIVSEFFGDGNIILCNKDMKILALMRSINVRHRELRVGHQYVPPPADNIDLFKMSLEDFGEMRFTSTPVAKWIGRTLGLPRRYAEEITRLAKIEKKTPGEEISNEDVKKIFEYSTQIINDVVSGHHTPIIIRDGDTDVHPISLGEKTDGIEKVSSFMDGLDTVFTESIVTQGEIIQTGTTDKKISGLETRLEEQKKAITIVTEKSKKISSVANLLYTGLSQGIISLDDPNMQVILNENNSKVIQEKGITYLKIDDVKIKINLESSIPSIASVLFNESKKQKAAISSIQKLIKKTEKELEKAIEKGENAKQSISFLEVRKKNWFERYRWFHTSDGNIAIGGRDASSNSAIIRKHVEKDDKIFHADIFGSPFFILKDPNKNATPASLNEVAHATVCFSRAWKEGMFGSSAYWVNPEQIKKAAPSGQFLSKGAFIIEGQRNFVKISTLKLCIVIMKKDGVFLLTCGPMNLKENCVCYAIIEPSGIEMVDVAKKIRLDFISKNEDIAKSFSVDDYVRILPTGSSKIIEFGIGNQNSIE